MNLRLWASLATAVALLPGCSAESDEDGADAAESDEALSKEEIKPTIARMRKEKDAGDYEGTLSIDGRKVSTEMSCTTSSCVKKHPAKCHIHVDASDASYKIKVKTDQYWLYHWDDKDLSLTVDTNKSEDWYSTKSDRGTFEVRYYHSQGLGGHVLRTVQFADKKVSFLKRDSAFKFDPANTFKWECSDVVAVKAK